MRLRAFDNPEFADRYTVVLYKDEEPYGFIAMNSDPFNFETGMCNQGSLDNTWISENERYEVAFTDLPLTCQKVIHLEFIDWPQTLQ